MSHYTQKQFIAWIRDAMPERFQGQKVLEVGSLDINGSARSFFSGCDYIGIDVGVGPGVDVVCGGQDYDAPDASFDVVCSFEAMEHNPYWKETFANMIRLLKPGGLLLMSCATAGRPEHGTARSKPGDSPLTIGIGWDYYRNLRRRDFEQAFALEREFSAHYAGHYYQGCDLFFFGFKAGAAVPAKAGALKASLRRRYFLRNLLSLEALRVMIQVAAGRLR